jgi:hypothetical protein
MTNIWVGYWWSRMVVGGYECGQRGVYLQKRKVDVDKDISEIWA